MLGDPDSLRGYQRRAYDAILTQLRVFRSTLLVMATGLGKTRTFAAVAKNWDGRVLILAHRRELIQQAWRDVTDLTGERVGIEKAHEHSYGARIVVGSVQTLKEARLASVGSPQFGLIIVDEAHHATAKTYRKIIAAFPNAKVLGVTATPRRGDRAAMGRVFESDASDAMGGQRLDMLWGIENGWLTPIEVRPISVDLDFAALKVGKDGEFDQGALDDAVATCARQIAAATIQHAGARRTVAFAPGVKTAHVTAETMNLEEPGSAYSLDGMTPDDERTSLLRRHKAGQYLRLCNCQVLTEGYDDPQLICLLIAIPCKTPSRLTQMIGRGTRLWPGIDQLPTVEERRAAIAASPKPYAVIYDLAGNNAEGCCATPVDVLGGTYNDDEKKLAKKKLKEKGGDVGAALEQARAEIKEKAARAMQIRARAKLLAPANPFAELGERDPEPMRVMKPENAATPVQLKILRDELFMDIPPNCSKRQARKLIDIGDARARAGLCNYRQIRWLDRFGINGRAMPAAVGARIAEAYRASGQAGERQMPPRAIIDAIIGGNANASGGAA
jgi:superfamily II DNA or RNA helicase